MEGNIEAGISPPTTEIIYPGFDKGITIINPDNPRDTEGLARIEANLNDYIYGGIVKRTPDGMRKWLNRDVVTDPKKIDFHETPRGRYKPEQVALGTERHLSDVPDTEQTIKPYRGTEFVLGSTKNGELKSYGLFINPANDTQENIDAFRGQGFLPDTKNYSEVSFVSADADENREPNVIGETMLQGSYIMAVRYAGKQAGEMLTDDDVKRIDQELSFYAIFTEDMETKTRKGFELAGYKSKKDDESGNPAKYVEPEDESDKDYVYQVSVSELHRLMMEKASHSTNG